MFRYSKHYSTLLSLLISILEVAIQRIKALPYWLADQIYRYSKHYCTLLISKLEIAILSTVVFLFFHLFSVPQELDLPTPGEFMCIITYSITQHWVYDSLVSWTLFVIENMHALFSLFIIFQEKNYHRTYAKPELKLPNCAVK